MFLRTPTGSSTGNCWEQAEHLAAAADSADAVVIGAGAGLSASAGLTYSGQRFEQNFPDWISRYGYHDMYTAGFYPYDTKEEYWAYWSRHIELNRYRPGPLPLYEKLRQWADGRDFFVLTTNVDHCFQKAGFDKDRLFYTQGDYGLWQCSVPCHAGTYDNEDAVRRMTAQQRDGRVPPDLVPRCPVCGRPMAMNLRCDNRFVEDDGWRAAAARYEAFLSRHRESRVLFLELGVGYNTPGIIKYPFWAMTARNPRAVYACINRGEAAAPAEIAARSLLLDGDIGGIVGALVQA